MRPPPPSEVPPSDVDPDTGAPYGAAQGRAVPGQTGEPGHMIHPASRHGDAAASTHLHPRPSVTVT
eukprot:gene46381-30675_t